MRNWREKSLSSLQRLNAIKKIKQRTNYGELINFNHLNFTGSEYTKLQFRSL